jgi:hypothetical protein
MWNVPPGGSTGYSLMDGPHGLCHPERMKKKPSKRSTTKSSQKLKEIAKKLSGGDVRDFEAMYEEGSAKNASRPQQPAAPARRRT